MKALYPSIGIERLCRLFGKTRQAFYDHSWRQIDEEMQEALIVDLVSSIRCCLPNVGGVKLLYLLRDDLASHPIFIGKDSFFTLLKKHDLLVRRKKRYAITTWSNHHYKKWHDLIKGLQVSAAEQLRVSDITYLRTDKRLPPCPSQKNSANSFITQTEAYNIAVSLMYLRCSKTAFRSI